MLRTSNKTLDPILQSLLTTYGSAKGSAPSFLQSGLSVQDWWGITMRTLNYKGDQAYG